MVVLPRLSLPSTVFSNASLRTCLPNNASRAAPRLLRLHAATPPALLGSARALRATAATSTPASFWTRRRLMMAASAGGGVALIFLLKQQKLVNGVGVVRAESNPWELSPRPPPVPSRVMNYGTNLNGLKITLYQYQTCPFCCKTRVFLDYFGISYDVVEVNSVKRTEIKWSKYTKVPLLLIETPEGKTVQLNDSSQIISVLKTFIDHKKEIPIDQVLKYYPHLEEKGKGGIFGSKTVYDFPNKYFLMYFDEPADQTSEMTSKARSLERKWRSWVDSDFVHRISPNIYGTFRESLEAFNYFDRVGQWDKIFSWFDRVIVVYVGAFVMRIVANNLKKKHELDDDVRDELNKSVKRFVKKALKSGEKDFAGGTVISLGDLALYGAMTSFQGCQAFSDMMAANETIANWFAAVQKAVDSHEGQALLREMVATTTTPEVAVEKEEKSENGGELSER